MFDLLFSGRHLRLESPLSLDEATTRLQRDVAVPEWRIFENRPQSFIGTFTGGRFHMMRLCYGRNSFRPMIDGQLSPSVNGCRADVRLKLPPIGVFAWTLLSVISVTALSLGIPQAVALAGDPAFVRTDAGLVKLILLFIGTPMLVGPSVITIIEAWRATRLLRRLFESATAPGASLPLPQA